MVVGGVVDFLGWQLVVGYALGLMLLGNHAELRFLVG